MTVALYAGSFDPIHLGHVGVIEHVARTADEVVVAVAANPSKTSGLLDPDVRVALVVGATAHLANVRVVRASGLTVDVARAVGADVLVRAAHKEQGGELSMAVANETMSGIRTLFVPVDPGTRAISSSIVRELVRAGRVDDACALVPAAVAAQLRSEPGPT